MDALIIKPKWLDKIFHEGKCLEIRGSNTTKRGCIGLAESGSSMIRGCCEIQTSYPIKDKEHWEQLKEFHQVDITWDELLQRYEHPHAWVLVNVREYEKPISYNHPKGAVIWVKNALKDFIKIENEWLELDKERQLVFNYNGGFHNISDKEINSSEMLGTKDWAELYKIKHYCPLETDVNANDVWVSPEGKFYDGEAHEVKAEGILEIIYNETDIPWAGDMLEERGWIKASADLMWEVRLTSGYWNKKKIPQKQYDSLWDWCNQHNKCFPKDIIVV